MQLSENFTLKELTKTGTGIKNLPDIDSTKMLRILCESVLQPLRDKFGRIKVNSGFRSKEVNEKINGSKTSQHCFGQAADIVPLEADIKEVFKWLAENAGKEISFGQCIFEDSGRSQWIHISLTRPHRENNQLLLMTPDKRKLYKIGDKI